VKLLHLPAHNSTELLHALVRALNELPSPLRRTVTRDQGTEVARHLEITQATGTRIYFCDSGSPWQRGSNENTNGLLRQYFPKSTDLSVHSARDLARVENELNSRPRITLGDRPAADLFATLLASENHTSLRWSLETTTSLWPTFRASSTRSSELMTSPRIVPRERSFAYRTPRRRPGDPSHLQTGE
jgi:IS30 family transposase